jgi:predicted permease
MTSSDGPGARWGLVWLERLWQDVTYGGRMLAASPGLTAVSVLSLAIGIGANCAIFSFADALLLRPLPVPRPGEVLTLGSINSLEALQATSLVSSYADYADIRDRNKSFEGLAAFNDLTVGFASDPDAPPKLKLGLLASDNLFSLMGVEPSLGRAFRPDENQVPGRDAVVVLGRTLWEQELGADPSVLGRTVRLNGIEFTVIGVAPAEFTGMNTFVRSDFFVPILMSSRLLSDPKAASLQARDVRDLTVKGRLKPGVTQAQAQAELAAIAADLERAYPETNRNREFAVRTELQARMAQSPPDTVLIAMLSLLAFAVLLIACANVAGLLTSRAPVRAREMALRLAIGAGRGRLVCQLVTESLLVALMGGALGLGIGYAGIRLFRQIELPTDLPIALTFQLDQRALLFSLVVAVASAVLFGLVPAIQATRTDLTAVMKATDAVAPGRRRRWGRAILVAGQVAVSVVLLVVAMFIFRGFRSQLVTGPGYRIDHLLLMSFDPTLVRYSQERAQVFFQQIAERARTLPGVSRVTMTSSIPMSNDSFNAVAIAPEGFEFPQGQDSVTVMAAYVDEHYFETLDIPLLAGRNFRRIDDADTPRVGIINQRLAEHYWPNQNPIGRRFRHDTSWVEVVGVARTGKYLFIAEAPTDFVYLPYRQIRPQRMVLVAQSAGDDPAGLAAPLRQVVRELDANQPIYNVRTMDELYRMRAVSIFTVLVTLVASLGAMGLALAIVGLYGLVAYAASRRTREIGIRMAVGADASTVLWMVLRQGIVLVGIGLAMGLAASLGAGELMRAAFPGGDVEPRDVISLLLVTPIVLTVTLLAAYIPARRASRVSLTQALRYE